MRKTILIVDDDSGVRIALREIFETLGHNSIGYENGEDTVSHISSADMLITDFNMPPGMNGAELAKMAKCERPDLPVIIMTGTRADVPSGHLANAVIEKPFDVELLEKVITDFL